MILITTLIYFLKLYFHENKLGCTSIGVIEFSFLCLHILFKIFIYYNICINKFYIINNKF